MATQQRRPAPSRPVHRGNRNEVKMSLPSASEPSTKRRPTHDQIAQRAYELYEARGRQPGHAQHDWLRAERELMLGR